MRICSGPGCLRAVPDDVRYCDECKPAEQPSDVGRVHTHGYDPELDRLRKSARWQRRRAQVVREEPFCRRCDLSPTDEVDHIVPAREAIGQAQASGRFPFDRYAGYFLRSNLQGLCRGCHVHKTLEDKTHVGPWRDVLLAEDQAPKRRYAF